MSVQPRNPNAISVLHAEIGKLSKSAEKAFSKKLLKKLSALSEKERNPYKKLIATILIENGTNIYEIAYHLGRTPAWVVNIAKKKDIEGFSILDGRMANGRRASREAYTEMLAAMKLIRVTTESRGYSISKAPCHQIAQVLSQMLERPITTKMAWALRTAELRQQEHGATFKTISDAKQRDFRFLTALSEVFDSKEKPFRINYEREIGRLTPKT